MILFLVVPRVSALAGCDNVRVLDASESAEELRNRPDTADVEKSAPGNDTLGFITLDVDLENSRICKDLQLHAHEAHEIIAEEAVEDPFVTDSRIKSLGNIEEADSDLESMPDDEIMSIYRNDNKEANSDQELSIADEKAVDNILDALINEANKEDTTIFAATTNENIPKVKIPNVQTLGAMRRFKEIQITKAFGSDPLGYLPIRLDFLAAQLPDLLTATIKNNLPQALTNAVRETLHGFNRRIRNAIKDEMPEVLNEYVLKPMNREFNALNKLESQRIGEVNGLLWQCAKHQMQLINYIEKILHLSMKVPRDILVVNAKHLQTKVDRTFVDLHELVDLVSQFVKIIGSTVPSAKATVEGEKESQEQPESTTADDTQNTKVPAPVQRELQATNTSVSQTSATLVEAKRLADLKAEREKSEKKFKTLTHAQLRAQEEELAKIEAKRSQHMNKMMDEYNHCINFRDDPQSITKFNYRLRRKGREELRVSWTGDQEPESGIFVYNGNLDLVFQRENEFHLAATTQLIRIQNAIKVDSVIAREMFDKMIYVIEAREDVVEARKIVQENLDDLG
ncbi:hypothetical protein Tco_0596539 [Tanacetum coccineum]